MNQLYVHGAEITRIRDESFKKRQHHLKGNLTEISHTVKQMRMELLKVQSKSNATMQSIKLEVDAHKAQVKGKVSEALEKIQIKGQMKQAEEERTAKKQLEIERMHEREREREEVAAKAAHKALAAKRAKEESATAQMGIDAAHAKLAKISEQAGKLPDQEG
jgi:hypothetical protein